MASELNVGTVNAAGGKVTVGDSSANELLVGFESSSQDYSIGANGNFFMVCANATDLDANQLLTISSAGNVGIGTSLPDGSLDIEKTINVAWSSALRANDFLQISNPSTTSGAYSGIELIATGTGSAGAAEIVCVDSGSGSGDLVFSTRNSSTWSEKMRIDSAGLATFSAGIKVTGSDGLQIAQSVANGGAQRLSGSTTCADNVWTEIAFVSHSFIARGTFFAYSDASNNGGALYDFGIAYGNATDGAVRTFHKVSTEILSVEAEYLNSGSTNYVMRVRVNLNTAANCTVHWTLDGHADTAWYAI